MRGPARASSRRFPILRKLAFALALVVASASAARAQFTSFCWGDGSNPVACPCGNSGIAMYGCSNSSWQSGAQVLGGGTTSPDTVFFTASALVPSSLAILVQADARSPVGGVVYGDGVDCLSGNRHALFRKSASSGYVVFPGPADPSITARSAALGDTIPQGGFRYYQVVYRDKVAGFCPSGGTWNITNCVTVAW